jgi:hypothetical protein
MNPPVPPVEKEKKALAKGEKLGFSSRESENATTWDPTRPAISLSRRRDAAESQARKP